MADPLIDPRAIVDEQATLGVDVRVGANAVIEAGVVLGEATIVYANAVVCRGSRIGARCQIHPGAVIGGAPQDRHYGGEQTFVEIGQDTIVREAVTINRATGEGQTTRIGRRCMLMACCHVAHNCVVEDDVVMANSSLLGGHVSVGQGAFLSGNTSVHQFCRIGRLAMMSGHSSISLDLTPFTIATGMRGNEASGLNSVGLRRAQMEPDARKALKHAFKLLCRSNKPLEEVLAELESHTVAEVLEFAAFIRSSPRGVIRQYGNPHGS